jgi:putative aldouronate transport system substrate-binding protein
MEAPMKKSMLLPLFVLLLMIFAGCSGRKDNRSSTTETPVGQYPVQTDTALRYWLSLELNTSANFANLGDTPFAKGLQERTGIKVNYLHPPIGPGAREQLNLMIADGTNLPDIIEWNWLTEYPGGPEKAIEDKVILRLNDVIDRYCPNLKAFLAEHPEYDRMIKTDAGSYYAFPFIRMGETTLYTQGLVIRKDWLEDLGMAPPATIDEWHDTLVAFRDLKKCPSPFTLIFSNNERLFVESFGLLKNFYINAGTGRIHWGRIESGYRDWLSVMSRWYRERLIDRDMLSNQSPQLAQKMTSGNAGATIASIGSGIGTWTNSARPANPRYELMAMRGPQRTEGALKIYGIPNSIFLGQSAAITASSRNIEIAARFLDYAYGPEGHMYYNFGTEGVSYNMIDGEPVYTDLVIENPQGWSVGQALSAYTKAVSGGGPMALDNAVNPQFYTLPEQKAALSAFNTPGASGYLMPPLTPTQEESRELAMIMNEINTYSEEMITKFIIGTETLNDASWNAYVNAITRLNINRALEIQNAAFDRYNRR